MWIILHQRQMPPGMVLPDAQGPDGQAGLGFGADHDEARTGRDDLPVSASSSLRVGKWPTTRYARIHLLR